jgi:hypothetical protein
MTTARGAAPRAARLGVATAMSAFVLCGIGALSQTQPTLQITSPADGTVVYPGQTVTVTVSPSAGATFTAVAILAPHPLPFQYLTIPPISSPSPSRPI